MGQGRVVRPVPAIAGGPGGSIASGTVLEIDRVSKRYGDVVAAWHDRQAAHTRDLALLIKHHDTAARQLVKRHSGRPCHSRSDSREA